MTRAHAGYLVTLAAGVAIGFAAVGTAAAGQAATVTHHYSLAASAFAPDSISNPTTDYNNIWDPTTLTQRDSDRCFNAGLSLPPNAKLKSITFYYTTGDSNMTVELNRPDLASHTYVLLAHMSTGTSSTPDYSSTTRSISAVNATVNMTKFAYSVGVCPRGTTTFSGITITYTQAA